MKAFLLFLSSLFAVAGFCRELPADTVEAAEAESPSERFSVLIDMGKGSLSGILLTRTEGDITLGCIVNEFGISALEFRYDAAKNKIKLSNVVKFLNKWYIKKVLGNDLKVCIRMIRNLPVEDSGKYDVSSSVGTITVLNRRRNITYSLSPLPPHPEPNYETEG